MNKKLNNAERNINYSLGGLQPFAINSLNTVFNYLAC